MDTHAASDRNAVAFGRRRHGGNPVLLAALAAAVLVTSLAPTARAHDTGAPHGRGVWFDARLDLTNAYEDMEGLVVLPGVAVGYTFGRIVLVGSFDTTYWHKNRETGSNSHVELDRFHLALGPEVEYEIFRPGNLAFFVGGGIRFRYYWESRKEVVDTVSSSKPRIKTLGFDALAGVGARYFLGHRIGLGLELGLVLAYGKARTSEQLRNVHEMFNMGPFGRMTVAVLW